MDTFTGCSFARFEDHALLTGAGRFIDDLGVPPGVLRAAFVRSPHAHADITSIDAAPAQAVPGVRAVVTGADLLEHLRPFTVGVKAPMRHYPLAVDRARWHGEPVAIVLADDAYAAEDGAAALDVVYAPRQPAVDPEAALAEDAPILHDALGGNVISDRRFRYGDPDSAFAAAAHQMDVRIRYPRNSVTPIETYGVLADHRPSDGGFDVTSNFQGPFALHPVMALALQVPASKLRLKTPPASGGSYGVKQGVFPYIVALCVAAKIARRPVKWIEDRMEHLSAATSATNRIVTLRAAFDEEGRVSALDWDQIEDCGAYLRAPEPATLYRMHGNMTGAYAIANLAIRNRNVLTNKTPTGLVRGFGGPQVYFALERLMAQIAARLGLDPLTVISRNLIPRGAFPYATASGGVYDSGDYQAALARLEADGRVDDLYRRRDAARAEGRLYGVGFAAVVEPSISNMGYITTVLTPEEREKAGPKGGAVATATVAVDALGSVSAHIASTPQGQGHRTVIAQVVADALGLTPDDVTVSDELDTGRDAWSVASGNYSSRFAGAVAGAAHLAASRLRARLAALAAPALGCDPEDVVFADGAVASRAALEAGTSFRRIAATSHWAHATAPQGVEPVLRETAFWSPAALQPPDAEDHINSSACHGFVLDACGVEIDRATGALRIDRYITVHDAGRLLNPALADGQIRGGFSNALGAAVYEQFAYGPDGAFLTGSFADYTIPTAAETPDIEILHLETPSPLTPLGAKGIGEGNCMSTPVCLANAAADALGVADIELPLTPARLTALMAETEPPRPTPEDTSDDLALSRDDFALSGAGDAVVAASPEIVWARMTNAESLRRVVPGCRRLDEAPPGCFTGAVEMGVGIVRGVFEASAQFRDQKPPHFLRLDGEARGPLGASRGEAVVALAATEAGCRIRYRYGVDLSGKVAAVGGRMIQSAARVLIAEFFNRIAADGAPDGSSRTGWLARLLRRVGWGAR